MSKKRPAELIRIHGPKAFRKWIGTQPCSACHAVGYSVSAHLVGNGGLSRKKSVETVGPLCHMRPTNRGSLWSCHDLFDNHRDKFDALYPTFNPERVARATQVLWALERDAFQWEDA